MQWLYSNQLVFIDTGDVDIFLYKGGKCFLYIQIVYTSFVCMANQANILRIFQDDIYLSKEM